jgi:hypothetical protein
MWSFLLPKKDGVTTPDGFRPTSLQNCTRKLAAKVLTNYLQTFIPDLIFELQTSFIKGRSIADNFLYA